VSGGAVAVTKMSGAGNDFIVLSSDEAAKLGDGLLAWVRRACRRGLSLGADGVLVLEKLDRSRVRMVFHNPDGSEAFCGNGSRCAARYATLAGWAGDRVTLVTSIGEIDASVRQDEVAVALPFAPVVGAVETFTLPGGRLEGTRVDAGTPHVVTWVADLASLPIADRAVPVRRDPRFAPGGTNVDFAQWLPDGSLGVRTWERGVEGETLSCGTGALAAAAVARLEAPTLREVRVIPRSAVPVVVEFAGRTVLLRGDARVVLRGEVPPEGTEGFEEP
jgi:diaminopimelate epimerase